MTPEQAEELLLTLERLEAILPELQAFRAEAMQNATISILLVSALIGATVAAVVVLCFGRWFRRGG